MFEGFALASSGAPQPILLTDILSPETILTELTLNVEVA